MPKKNIVRPARAEVPESYLGSTDPIKRGIHLISNLVESDPKAIARILDPERSFSDEVSYIGIQDLIRAMMRELEDIDQIRAWAEKYQEHEAMIEMIENVQSHHSVDSHLDYDR